MSEHVDPLRCEDIDAMREIEVSEHVDPRRCEHIEALRGFDVSEHVDPLRFCSLCKTRASYGAGRLRS